MKYVKRGLAAVLLAASVGSANAVDIVSLVGDKDGFGIGAVSGGGFDFDLIGAGDGNGTDVWRDGNLVFVHDYTLPTSIAAASLELVSGGWGLDAAASLYLNGTYVGNLSVGDNTATGPVLNYAFKDVFDLTPFKSLLTGHDSFEVRLVDGDDDSGALDYSQLTVTTAVIGVVPEPSTYALTGLGLSALFAARRRRRDL